MKRTVLKSISRTVVIAVAIGLPLWVLVGADAAAPRIPRIGVVRMRKIFQDYDYAKAEKERIIAIFKPQSEELSKLAEVIKKMKTKLATNRIILPRSTEFELEKLKIQELVLDLQARGQKFDTQRRKYMAAFYRKIYTDFRRAVTAIGKQNFDLIITAPEEELAKETATNASPAAVLNEIQMRRVQYISKSVDNTDWIVRQMNHNYKLAQKRPQ